MLFEEIKVGMKIKPQTAKGFEFSGNFGSGGINGKRIVPYSDGRRDAPTSITCIDKYENYAEFLLEFDDLIHHGEYRECINRGSIICGSAYLEPLVFN